MLASIFSSISSGDENKLIIGLRDIVHVSLLDIQEHMLLLIGETFTQEGVVLHIAQNKSRLSVEKLKVSSSCRDGIRLPLRELS